MSDTTLTHHQRMLIMLQAAAETMRDVADKCPIASNEDELNSCASEIDSLVDDVTRAPQQEKPQQERRSTVPNITDLNLLRVRRDCALMEGQIHTAELLGDAITEIEARRSLA